MTAAEESDLVQAEEVCRRLLAIDLSLEPARKDGSGVEDGRVRNMLKEVLVQDEADGASNADENKENDEDRV